jgi:hypothetical protein
VDERYIVEVEKKEEERQHQEESLSLLDAADDAHFVGYHLPSDTVPSTSVLAAATPATTVATYPPIYGQIIPTTLRKILPRECTLSEASPSESNVAVTTPSLRSGVRIKTLPVKKKTETVQTDLSGYRKILPAPSVADPISLFGSGKSAFRFLIPRQRALSKKRGWKL